MTFRLHTLFLALALLLPAAARAQFSTTFDTVGPEWIVNRYAPAGFSSTPFLGDNRLQLSISSADSAANRPVTFSDPLYNTQGREQLVNIAGAWTLSAQVYIPAAFAVPNTTIARSDLWGATAGAYMIFGFTNASPTDGFNPAAADRSFRFRAFNVVSGAWIELGLPSGFSFDAWHTLTATSTGNAFEYRLDGQLLATQATTGNTTLTSAQLQAYNFGQAAGYSVYWDNLSATSAIPEPATTALLAALATLGLAIWHRRRA